MVCPDGVAVDDFSARNHLISCVRTQIKASYTCSGIFKTGCTHGEDILTRESCVLKC